MKNFKSAFTMIELVFVIVVLGILAGIAIPKLAVTRDDATMAKIKADIASIQSGISIKRGEEMLSGRATWPEVGENFENVVNGGVKINANGRNGWQSVKTAAGVTTAEVCVAGQCADFIYYQTGAAETKDSAGVVTTPAKAAGSFECKNSKGDLCSSLK